MDVPARINLFRNGEEISRRAGKVSIVILSARVNVLLKVRGVCMCMVAIVI